MLKRAWDFLNKQVFGSTGIYFEKALDIDPTIGEAYLGKGLSELGYTSKEELKNIRRDAKKNYYINKALTFSKEPLKSELYEQLGIRKPDSVENSIIVWRQEVREVLQSFIKYIREITKDSSSGYTEEYKAISDKYDGETDKIKSRLSYCSDEIVRVRTKEYKTIDGFHAMDRAIADFEAEIKSLKKKLNDLNNKRNNEFYLLSEKYPEHKDSVNLRDYLSAAEKFPIPLSTRPTI